jgi:uncharacterized protein (DUF1697 family)
MATYVVFLRGINVGGHIVKKEQLQQIFASIGLPEAQTFKQSGNIIFQTHGDTKILERLIKSSLKQSLNYDVEVFVRSLKELEALIKLDPFENKEERGSSFQVTFLQSNATLLATLPLRIPNSSADIIGTKDREIFSITRGGGDGGKPNPYIEKQLRMAATTRNWNIIKQIVDFCGEKCRKMNAA